MVGLCSWWRRLRGRRASFHTWSGDEKRRLWEFSDWRNEFSSCPSFFLGSRLALRQASITTAAVRRRQVPVAGVVCSPFRGSAFGLRGGPCRICLEAFAVSLSIDLGRGLRACGNVNLVSALGLLESILVCDVLWTLCWSAATVLGSYRSVECNCLLCAL